MPEIRFPILLQRDDAGYLGDAPNTIGKMARVSKATARRLYDAGVEVVIVACKFLPHPDAPNGVAMRMPPAREYGTINDGDPFDRVVNAYAFANCTHETGYYPAFWVRYETYHLYAERPGPGRYRGVAQAPDSAPNPQ